MLSEVIEDTMVLFPEYQPHSDENKIRHLFPSWTRVFENCGLVQGDY